MTHKHANPSGIPNGSKPADIIEAEARGFRKGLEAAARHVDEQAGHLNPSWKTMLKNIAREIRALEPDEIREVGDAE